MIGIGYSIPALSKSLRKHNKLDTPGPGARTFNIKIDNIQRMMDKGAQDILSKRSTHRGNSFSHSNRLLGPDSKDPGPGAYNPDDKKVSKYDARLLTEPSSAKCAVFGK